MHHLAEVGGLQRSPADDVEVQLVRVPVGTARDAVVEPHHRPLDVNLTP